MSTTTEQPPFLTKKDYLVRMIRECILSGELRPGDRLSQRELAERFNLSVTPVREALSQLESEGIITYSPHRGARVVTVTPKEAAEICLVRATLEELALELAFPHLTEHDLRELVDLQTEIEEALERRELARTRRLNHEFHLRMYRNADNRQLIEVIEFVWYKLPWDVLPALYRDARDIIHEHRILLDALQRSDLVQAKRAIRDHILHWGGFLADYLGQLQREAEPEPNEGDAA